MMLPLYKTVTALAAPAVRAYLLARRWRGKEDNARINERYGYSSRARPEGQLVWLHAASIGESLSMLPLVEHLLKDRPEMHMLVTTGTVTSAKLMAERLPPRSFHQYAPVDRAAYVRRFLDHWQPDLALWAESEFWPNLISETHSRAIPMVLVNGRISTRSFLGWKRARGLIAGLLKDFVLCLAQTQEDAERLKALGARQYKYLGNLKFAGPPLPADENQLATLTAAIGDRPRWLAASTHPGEEIMVADVHRTIKAKLPGLVTLIAPRHPHRGNVIASALRDGGLILAQRSKGETIDHDTDIYLADSLGELGLLFRLVGVVFMGKSLVPLGGQNPLEALRLDCAVLHGPNMDNFRLIAEQMCAADCAVEVADKDELAIQVGCLLTDQDKTLAMILAGRAFAGTQAEVIDSVATEIEAVLRRMTTTADHDARA